jgi:hypothetical protein
MQQSDDFERLIETLKLCIAALREQDVPFMLGGSLAAWARGGPQPKKDIDLMVKRGDADRALQVLAGAGLRTERPPEEWLYKAWHGDVLIDLIFRPSGLEMTDEVFERAETISVLAVAAPVMSLEDVLTTKLHALDEHSLDYSNLLAIARAVREQIDWPQLRARAGSSPYARAFLTLVQELAIAPAGKRAQPAAPSRVRVLNPGA